MRLKINRYEFEVSNKDWILDNGSVYQCMTLKHSVYNRRLYQSEDRITQMSRTQFKQLLKDGKLVEVFNSKVNLNYPGCRIWRFETN